MLLASHPMAGWLANCELERIWKEAVMNWTICPGIWLERLEKITENLIECNPHPDRDSNRELSA
jgi:hypothetical protein